MITARCTTLLLILVSFGTRLLNAEFILADEGRVAPIVVGAGEPVCVRLAAEDIAHDVAKITGVDTAPAIVSRLDESSDCAVLISTLSQPESAGLLEHVAPALLAKLKGKWEAFAIQTLSLESGPVRELLVIAGSDARGTMFGLYAFAEEYLSVDPLWFWTDRPPLKRDRLAWPEVRLSSGEPTFRYRGWFLNDEDLLVEWKDGGGVRDIDYPYYHQVTAPEVHERVFESMLRLRYNIVIPASFCDITNPDEKRMIDQAVRRGLDVTMHHIEPLGVSGFGFQNFWERRGRPVPYSYTKHPEAFEETWRFFAKEWAQYPTVVWQLGLRGIADRPIWSSDPHAPKTSEARGRMISEAMAKQWEIVKEADPRSTPPATTTLWMEGAELHRQGHLAFPQGVAVIFADNSPGWELQRDFYEVEREPDRDYGIYYHHQLWGSGPHLVQAVSPEKTHEIFRQAVGRETTHYAMLNVGNVREFVLGIEASARMLWDFESFDSDRFMNDWCEKRFGGAAPLVREAYDSFFAAYTDGTDGGVPEFLDGKTLHRIRDIYSNLSTEANLRAEETHDWRPPSREHLKRVRRQIEAVEASGEAIPRIQAALDDRDRPFFEANFVAQWKIRLGLLRWLEAAIQSSLAAQNEDLTALAASLDAAEEAIGTVRGGQALATQGRWTDWYRGDRKMNIGRAETITRQFVEATREKARPGRNE